MSVDGSKEMAKIDFEYIGRDVKEDILSVMKKQKNWRERLF